jgi:hypothetical protein
MKVNIAMRQSLVDINCPRALIEKILSSFKRTLVMKVVPQNESVGATNHSCGFQFCRDASGGISRVQKYKRLPRRTDRLKQSPSKPSPARENGQQKECEKDAHPSIV